MPWGGRAGKSLETRALYNKDWSVEPAETDAQVERGVRGLGEGGVAQGVIPEHRAPVDVSGDPDIEPHAEHRGRLGSGAGDARAREADREEGRRSEDVERVDHGG